MRRRQSLTLVFALFFQVSAHAETLSFGEVWRMVRETSPAQAGSQLRIQATEQGLSRAENHWLPKVYLTAQSYRTNDPGNVFFGLLEQRSAGSQDFSPDSLNRPEAQTYTRGALGVDLALYEGGAKQAQIEMYNHLAASEKMRASQIEIEQYVQSGLAYGSIATIKKQRTKLQSLNEQLSKLIRGYQLGQKSNPVGYSGLLGMKSLANRIAGLIDQLDAEERASFRALHEMGVKSEGWSPEPLDARAFADRYLRSSTGSTAAQSFGSTAEIEAAQASAQASKMERAKYLPRVGAFAESYIFKGTRDTANGYMGGLYLQWSLFDPSDFGKYKEAKLAALANERLSQAAIQREAAEREGLQESERSIRANLERFDESDNLLAEQTRVSSTLFRNGSINALQFVEILNRRTDLIAQQSETEMALLKTAADRTKKLKFEIPDQSQAGGRK